MGFWNRKISTLAGIIILLLITAGVGYFIIYQVNEINKIRIEAIQKSISSRQE